MPAPRPTEPLSPPAAPPGRAIWLGALGLVLVTLGVYRNSFGGVFLFDDRPSIVHNHTLPHLASLGQVLSPPSDCTVSGRPLANLTLAINYAISGLEPWSYHVVNLLIHLCAGLTLFGIVRRTLRQPALRDRFGADALLLALTVAGLWLLHPLQTESVTYIIQRVEALGGMFYLLTLYCFMRSTTAAAPARWQALAVLVCLLGMTSKEVMVSAPLFVLLYDRTLVAGSFTAAWRRRRWLYVGLAATWLPLAWLVHGTTDRSGTAGFGTASSWEYLLTQCGAIAHYLRLCLWPSPLVFDYGWGLVRDPLRVLPQALLLLVLFGLTLRAVGRNRAAGLAGVWFFAILAPSSSVLPIASQTMAEHRMYLPLAAVLCLAVVTGYAWLGRRGLAVWLVAAAGWGWLTVQRNEVYHSELAMTRDTARHQPDNPRALTSLGMALYQDGQISTALPLFEKAVRLEPNYPHARITYGATLIELGRMDEARAQCEAALRLWPKSADAHHNLGLALYGGGHPAEAILEYETALRLQPAFPEGEADLGLALAGQGRTEEAIRHYQAALRLKPDCFPALNNLGTALLNTGRYDEARAQLQTAVKLKPDSAEAQCNLGLTLYAVGRNAEAAARFATAAQLQPDFADAHNNLGLALEAMGRIPEARAQYGEALRLRPDFTPARDNWERLEAPPKS